MTSDEFLGKRRRALEESFFERRNRELLEQMQQQLAAQERKKALSAASGITNEALLDELVAINLNAETLAALSLVPLVAVAWADGQIDPQEHQCVLDAAEDSGLNKSDPSYQLLNQWLQTKPDDKLLTVWKDYVRVMVTQLSDETRQKLKEDLLGRARDVAKAAGGLLGMGRKVSKVEQAMLDELETTFES